MNLLSRFWPFLVYLSLLAPLAWVSPVPRAAADGVKGADDKTQPGQDHEVIQGNWKVVAMVRNGEAVPDEELQDEPMSATFEGDTFTLSKGESRNEADFRLDPSRSPRQITITPRSGGQKGKARTSIYELSGEKLKIAFRLGGDADTPPADFSHAQGVRVMTLERQKGQEKMTR